MFDQSWTWDIPTKPGIYWYCGSLWGKDVQLCLVSVHKCINGLTFLARGNFLYPRIDGIGVWKKATLPDMPMG